MNMTVPFEKPLSELAASTDPLILEIADLAIEIFENRHIGMPAYALNLLADLADRVPTLSHYEKMALSLTFEERASHGPKTMDGIFLGMNALQLADAARTILKAYDIIDTGRGPKAVKKLWSAPLFGCDWMKAGLLNFAWGRRKTCCPCILGFLVALTHQAGRGGSYCIECFGPETTTKMFQYSSKMGMAAASPPPKSSAQKLVYRGGFASDPSKLASGMCWTEDRAQAAWFADRRLGQKGDAFILSTRSNKRETLARFQTENEVVLAFNKHRTFEVIATGESECRAFLAKQDRKTASI